MKDTITIKRTNNLIGCGFRGGNGGWGSQERIMGYVFFLPSMFCLPRIFLYIKKHGEEAVGCVMCLFMEFFPYRHGSY